MSLETSRETSPRIFKRVFEPQTKYKLFDMEDHFYGH